MSPLLALAMPLASAAPLTTCTSTARGPEGASLTVQGFGVDEADARRAARQSARLLVDQRLLIEVSLAWLGPAAPDTARLAGWIQGASSASFATPGWSFDSGECTTAEIAGEGMWTARWDASSELVTRATPADALEAARRRACLTSYQVASLQTLKARIDGGPDAPLEPWLGAWNGLLTCWGQPPPAPAPAPAGDTDGPTRCVSIGPDGASRALGFGTSAERAAEDALRQTLIAQSRQVVAGAMSVMLSSDATDREKRFADHLQSLAGLTGASDAVDRARLACASVTPGPMSWRPTGRLEKDCNSASWLERPKTPVAAAGAGAFLDETCALQVDPTMQIVRFSLRSAEGAKRDELVASGLRVTGTCESACYADALWGTEPKPIALAGAPDRSDKRKIVGQLTAMQSDPLRGLQLLPTLQDPGALGRLFDGSLWAKLEAEMSSLAGNTERWKQVEGHWIPLPPR